MASGYPSGPGSVTDCPRSAEWEYAARPGTATRYWWGDGVEKNRANCARCGSPRDAQQTAPVGVPAEPLAWGLHDTAGNVWEWMQDCWHENYAGAPKDGSKAWEVDGGDCLRRVIRGGSWTKLPRYVRAAFRDLVVPAARPSPLGFRLAQNLN